jgi:hypothetical protein
MKKQKRLSLSLDVDDFIYFQNLSEKTGLAKSTLFMLIMNGFKRDIENAKYTESIRLVEAWCSKSLHKVILTRSEK